MKNAFGNKIPEIKTILKNGNVKKYIETTLKEVLTYLEIKEIKELVDFAINNASTYQDISDYEKKVHLMFDKKRGTQRIPVKLSNRAQLMFNQIKNHVKGRDVLDLGCGDGKVGEILQDIHGRDVILVDVYEHGNISNINLPFGLIKQNKKIPFLDSSFDTTLLLTVLHHSDDPVQVLEEARRVTKKGGRVLIIESVYGVEAYGALSEEEQRLANIFFDHFYNRIIHYSDFEENKVNVPFNFQTPQNWNTLFKKEGFSVVNTIELGFDQKTVPEFHTLHVLEVA